MTSDRALRACMQALVLLNLVFVQLTGAAGLHWLAPLYALTLGAPLLERFREKLVYRGLWNAGVVAFSLLLLRHAQRAELAYVLEDGLVLAVLCQVHLLNNLRSSQRPDLLFFNAFLIAIIAGFLNRDVGFPAAFLAFAPSFVIGLQLLAATRGGRVLSAAVTRRLVADGARRSAALLAVSLLVFLFWPRDFDREPLFQGTFELAGGAPSELEIGFSEELVLDRAGPVGGTDEPALSVTLLAGRSADVPALWRGATLGSTSGGAWRPTEPGVRRSGAPPDDPWRGGRGRLTRSGAVPPDATRVEVVRHEQGTERVFAPLQARGLRLTPEHGHRLLRPRVDGTLDTSGTAEVRYEVELAPEPGNAPGGPRPDPVPAELAPYVELPRSPAIATARALADRLAARLPAEAEQHELVALVRDHLAREYTYLPPGTDGAARTLAEFVAGTAGGHCEFFASALATMLRSLGVPCRVVTGLRSTRWGGPDGRVLTFGTLDAHAWVEVCDPAAGWYAVDPSPIAVGGDARRGLWARLSGVARSGWAAVTGFDATRRAAVLAWLGELPQRVEAELRERPLVSGLVVALFTLHLAGLARARRARCPPDVRAYRAALRRARLRLLPGETPRELLARARAEGLAPDAVATLETATRRHEETRYAA